MLHLVAIGWMFVVLMAAAAEAASPQGTLLGAFFTLLGWGVIPLAIVLYILGTPARRRARRAAEDVPPSSLRSLPPEGAVSRTGEPGSATPASAANPDRSGHAAGDAVAPKREEA